MKTIRLIPIFCFCLSTFGFSQGPLDFRDNFTGYYQGYNDPFQNILVEKDTATGNFLIISDSIFGDGPFPNCPVNCYKHYVNLYPDSSWIHQTASYSGHFKRLDTIHVFYVAPGPFVYNYDAKKISPIGLYSLNKKEKEWYLFPNPASNELSVILPGLKEELSLLLLDINGKLLMEQQFIASTRLNVGTLPRGVYVLKIKGKEINLSKRVVLAE